jgi:clan AA aspartic protease
VGEVYVPIAVINPRTGARSQRITALADTGATLSLLPGALLESIGIDKGRNVTVVLADGRRVARSVGDGVIAVNEDSTPCRIVFGESGDAALLGLTVLEQLGLTVDPVERRLVPRDFLLYTFS